MYTLKHVIDAVGRMDAFRGDTNDALYAQQLVRVTFQELFRHEFPLM